MCTKYRVHMFNVGKIIMQSFEYKGMTAAGVTDYTNQTPKPLRVENVQVQRKIFFKCSQNRRYTCSMHE